MKFENKGKWIKQINESSQKNEADAKSVIAGMTKDQAKKLYDKINNWGLNSFDIKDRAALLKEIDNKFHFSKQKNEDTRQWHKLSDIAKDDKPFIVIGKKDSSNNYYINVVASLYDLTNFSNGIWFDLDDKAFSTKEQAYDRAKKSYPKAKVILANKKDFNNTRLSKYTNESAQKNESLRDLNLELADDTNALAAAADKIRQRFEYRTLQNQSYDEKQAEKIYLELRRVLQKVRKDVEALWNKIG